MDSVKASNKHKLNCFYREETETLLRCFLKGFLCN